MNMWILEAGPGAWERKGLRVFRGKQGVIAEMENNLRPNYLICHGYEIIEHTRDDLIRFIHCYNDGVAPYEVAQAVPASVEGSPQNVWVITAISNPRNILTAYTTREEAERAFNQVYGDANQILSYRRNEKQIFECYSEEIGEPEDSDPEVLELATGVKCPIEDTPRKLQYQCPHCTCHHLFYIQDNFRFTVEPRYWGRIVHDNPIRVDPSLYRETPPFYLCRNCHQVVRHEDMIVRTQAMLVNCIRTQMEL